MVVALPGSSLLIANRRVALHRRLGLTSVVLLAVMIPIGFTTTTAMVRRRFDLSGDQHANPHPDGQTALDAPTASVFNFAALLTFIILAIVAAVAFDYLTEKRVRFLPLRNVEIIVRLARDCSRVGCPSYCDTYAAFFPA